jgi:hypothetical protein
MQKKQVKDLSIGDALQSGGVVTHSPIAGLKTPKGKVELGIDGYLKVWNKYNTIAIKDK